MRFCSHGNFSVLPNEVFLRELTVGESAVYSFPRRYEGRKARQCWPSIKTIGKAIDMNGNTVHKYVRRLEGRGIITTESIGVTIKAGGERNGNLRFILHPTRRAMDEYYTRQMEGMELTAG